MNSIVLVGRLGKDPETKQTPNGNTVTTMCIAVDKVGKDKQKETDWIDCTAFGKTGEIISGYCKKGSQVGVVGSLQTRTWKDNDGKNHKFTFVMVDKVELMGKAPEATEQSGDVPFEM